MPAQSAPEGAEGEMLLVPRRLLSDLAAELTAEVRDRWHWPHIHPANVRKYEGDMSSVNEALILLAAPPRP